MKAQKCKFTKQKKDDLFCLGVKKVHPILTHSDVCTAYESSKNHVLTNVASAMRNYTNIGGLHLLQ